MSNDPRLKIVRRVSKLMDEEFAIGKFKFGIDPLLNLIPIAGDIGGYVISMSLIITMLQHGASGKVVAKMVLNASLDALIGAIPFLGWIFDFTFKANTRNVKLLSEHYTDGKHRGSALPIITVIIIIMLLVIILLIFLVVRIFYWLDGLVTI
ncbi:MAG TPA: DUF4112 domain-containing protein [Niabella sp.]|nr:DUF4112 domain-containing protein [Niabella sp.]HRC09790.1 DUF4112 domain-containing protein [Niabella sp.]